MSDPFYLSRDDIKDHFDEFIFGFIYHDIDRCIRARANYVVALALLSYTEYLGGLISGNLGSKHKGIPSSNFKKALKYFPNEYDSIDLALKIEYPDKSGKIQKDNGIYGVFRCGLVHEYFVKGLATINNNPDGHAVGVRIGIEIKAIPPEDPLYKVSQKRLLFRTNEYFRDFKLAAEKIYQELVTAFDAGQLSVGKGQFKLLTDLDVKSLALKGFCDSLKMYSSRRIVQFKMAQT